MRIKLLLTMALLLLLPCMAKAETAQDITRACIINNQEYREFLPDKLRDNSYRSIHEGKVLSIQAPEGQLIGSVLIKWRTINMPGIIIKTQKGDEWVETQRCDPDFAAQYVVLAEPAQSIRILAQTGVLQISEVTVLTPGDAPADVQVWREPPEKVDLMIFSTHPDDEVLWFGGMLPTYAGEQKKDVLVVNAVYSDFVRRLELLDSLWTCGVDVYPVFLGYPNQLKSIDNVITVWRQKFREPENTTLSLVRRYKPDVVVLQDVDGEYGHFAHIVFSSLGRQAVERAADAAEHPESAEEWGVWDVPKTYIHLYAENQLHMDWTKPLTAFNGKTGIEVAEEALACHVSQVGQGWTMSDAAEYDNSLFGLWRTTVGTDVLKNDLFEHIGAE